METLTTVQTRPPDTSRLVSAVALGTERRSVSRARHHTTAVLCAWELQGLSHSAELVVSELVTNALQAVWSARLVLPVLMRLRSDGERLIIEVWDAAPAAPELREHAADAIGGRGLEIVSLISDSWGYYPEHGGKVVWAALTAP
jgi:anti-sigma regulatory factor (Ser/Thr protein kinase)